MTTTKGPDPAVRNRDLLALRAFVTARDGQQEQQQAAAGVVALDLTHSNLRQRHLESRFPVDATLYDLRLRFYRSTGTPPRDQHLLFYDEEDIVGNGDNHAGAVREVPADAYADSDDQIPLLSLFRSSWRVGGRRRVHCVDTNPHSASAKGALEDVALVEKFRLSDEDYDRRSGTLRDWCRRQKALDPHFTLEKHAAEHRALMEARRSHKVGAPLPAGFAVDQATGQVVRVVAEAFAPTGGSVSVVASSGPDNADDAQGEESVRHASLGIRCQVSPGDRRGVVRWTGQLPGKSGWWVGVLLDEPVGNNDGCLDGVRYFEAELRRGCFVRGTNLQVGDFPERDLFDDSDEDSEGEM